MSYGCEGVSCEGVWGWILEDSGTEIMKLVSVVR